MSKFKPTLCIDFDGVLHSYTSGWNGAAVVSDPPVRGAMEWLLDLIESEKYVVCIYSSRSKDEGGVEAMQEWINLSMLHNSEASRVGTDRIEKALAQIQYPTEKPPAYLTIDDRAICFRGTFPSQLEIDSFKPWNK